jgi:hypothetical protein
LAAARVSQDRCRRKREKAEGCWGDETGVRSDESGHCGYGGQRPIIKIATRRKIRLLIAAVTNQGKVRFMIYAGCTTPQRPSDHGHRAQAIFDAQQSEHTHGEAGEWLAADKRETHLFCFRHTRRLNPSEYSMAI